MRGVFTISSEAERENKIGSTIKCAYCERPFQRRYPNNAQKYCSNQCAKDAKREKSRIRMQTFRFNWNKILKKYRYEDIGKAYDEHGKLMNHYHTGKGTNNFGGHANPDFDKEIRYVRREKQRRGL